MGIWRPMRSMWEMKYMIKFERQFVTSVHDAWAGVRRGGVVVAALREFDGGCTLLPSRDCEEKRPPSCKSTLETEFAIDIQA